jgi:hypothetical protein
MLCFYFYKYFLLFISCGPTENEAGMGRFYGHRIICQKSGSEDELRKRKIILRLLINMRLEVVESNLISSLCGVRCVRSNL